MDTHLSDHSFAQSPDEISEEKQKETTPSNITIEIITQALPLETRFENFRPDRLHSLPTSS